MAPVVPQEMVKNLRINSLPAYALGSIQEIVREQRRAGRDVIDLSQANPDLQPPAKAIEHLVQATLRPHNHRYSSSQGITKLREAICSWYWENFSVEFDPEHEVLATSGTKEGLAHLLSAIVSPGENVLIPTPSYPVHCAAVFIAGCNILSVPISSEDSVLPCTLTEHSEHFFDCLLSVYERANPKPRVMILNFPHNPTATIVTEGFYQRLVEIALKEKIYLLHDFAYADICYDTYQAPSIFQIKGSKEIAVEFYSLSKAMGVPGWRVGCCVGNPELISALKRIKSYLDFGIFQPLQIAALKLFLESGKVAEEAVAIYQARRDVLIEGLSNIDWLIAKPKASLFVWAKIPQNFIGMGSLVFAEKLLREAAVAVCPGSGFDSQSDNYVRFALVANEARLRQAVKNITSFLKEAF